MLNKDLFQGDSEEDQDYNPTKKEEAEYHTEHKKKAKRKANCSAKQLFEELKKEQNELVNKKPQSKDQDAVEIAQRILTSEAIKPKKRIMFAGKQFVVNEQTGQLEQVIKKFEAKQKTEGIIRNQKAQSYAYLNHVLEVICNRSRKINSVGKSKLDWNGFVKKEGLQDQLKYNRKGGVISDIQFIQKDK